LICCALLVAYRWVNPPVTTIQVQRRIESWFSAGDYESRQRWIPLEQIPRALQRAVIAAEDGAFFEHSGIDWKEMRIVVDDARSGRRVRGGSTITQQLVKNLFLTTHSSVFRKLPEYALTPVAERVLGKDRILELYLNEIEWGPGIWGVGAAAQYHYNKPAERLGRNEAARLAACIPAPRTRRPNRMDSYSGIILERMGSRGW
jgi:monofunctional biosynthetic peptidoglycan transglycosylase